MVQLGIAMVQLGIAMVQLGIAMAQLGSAMAQSDSAMVQFSGTDTSLPATRGMQTHFKVSQTVTFDQRT